MNRATRSSRQTSGPRRRAAARGFTLLEIVIVLALITILAGLSIGGLELMKARAGFASTAGDLVSALRRVQSDAYGNGSYTAFVIDTSGGKWWALENLETGFTLANFDPAHPTTRSDGVGVRTLLASGVLPSGIQFAGYGATLPAPFANVPTTTTAGAQLAACSFCSTSPVGNNPAGSGAIVFQEGAPAQFTAPPNAIAQQFSFSGTVTANGAQSTRKVAVVIVPRTSLIETYEAN